MAGVGVIDGRGVTKRVGVEVFVSIAVGDEVAVANGALEEKVGVVSGNIAVANAIEVGLLRSGVLSIPYAPAIAMPMQSTATQPMPAKSGKRLGEAESSATDCPGDDLGGVATVDSSAT